MKYNDFHRQVSKLRTRAVQSPDEEARKLMAEAADTIAMLTPPPSAEVPLSRAELLHQAEVCVCGHREEDYGTPEDSFGMIAGFWSTYLGYDLTSVDVGMMMALLKIARVAGGRATNDSFVDLAGYAACAGEIAGKKREVEE